MIKAVNTVGSDAEYLVYRLTGWQMPVYKLPLWIKGLPGDTDYDINATGQVTNIKTPNWQMQYQPICKSMVG